MCVKNYLSIINPKTPKPQIYENYINLCSQTVFLIIFSLPEPKDLIITYNILGSADFISSVRHLGVYDFLLVFGVFSSSWCKFRDYSRTIFILIDPGFWYNFSKIHLWESILRIFFEDFYENLANFRPREGTNCRQYAVILEHKSAIFELEPLYSSENLCQNFLNSSS